MDELTKARIEAAKALLGGCSSVQGFKKFLADVKKVKEGVAARIKALSEAIQQAKEEEAIQLKKLEESKV